MNDFRFLDIFLHSVVWAPNKLRPLFCKTTSCTLFGFVKCWYGIYRYVVDLCVYICAFAHICMSGGNLVLNVLRFWVELYLDDASLLHDFDDKSLNWFVPLLSKVKKK